MVYLTHEQGKSGLPSIISPILAQCSICLGGVRLSAVALSVALSTSALSNRKLVVAITIASAARPSFVAIDHNYRKQLQALRQG